MLKRVFGVLLLFSLSFIPRAQVREDQGLMGLTQTLERLDIVGSVLHTGAHPDDENSSLLAWLSRGQGVRTAYLSATRGDGGQNLVGSELFESIGVLRTDELLAARKFDRAGQFFTPNMDFGFSKSADETMEKWGRDRLIGDFVRVIRMFRPEIVIARFTGTTRDGHGHHQAAGIATREAIKAAADPAKYAEFGKPWTVKKYYLNAMGAEQGRLRINVGEYSPIFGRSFNEIAMEGRSLHRSQSMGAAREKGPRYTQLQLAEKTVNVADDAGLFEGTIHKLTDIARLEPALAPELNELQRRIDAIRSSANLTKTFAVAPQLAGVLKLFREIRNKANDEHVRFLLNHKEADFQEAARLAAGLVVDVMVGDETVIPGQEFDMTVVVVNGGPYDLPAPHANTELPEGWTAQPVSSTGSLKPGERFEQKFKVRVAPNAEFTQPYWLKHPRQGDRFVWSPDAPAAMPFDAALLPTRAEIDFEGTAISLGKNAEHRLIHDIYGELRSQLKVAPALSVKLAPEVAVVPTSGDRRKLFTVTVENQDRAGGEAEVRLALPQGWTSAPATQKVTFAREGEKATVTFTVTAPAVTGDFKVGAVARFKNQDYAAGFSAVKYPHVETRHVFAPAESRVRVFEVMTSTRSVGYVEGAGDRVADSLRELGVNVTLLSAGDLAMGDLSRFNTIVLGIRAYAVRDDLRSYNRRLLDYVSNGGTLIVQYNTYEILDSPFGPYPFNIRRPHDRVTREEAPVRILDPAHPAMSTPNKISERDFEGWVQERGLYFLGEWDPRYVPLLESNDPGESPLKGGLVVARHGKGIYVYTGYAFFRELPAGVPGAFRLFANLVSLKGN